MDKLPLELLQMISDLIEEDSGLYTRQCAVAALSRVSKHCYSIYSPELCLKPILTSEKQAMKWGRSYASRVNPWTVLAGEDALRDVIVPTSINFSFESPSSDDSTSTTTLLPHPINTSICVSTPFTAFFFRDLTSFALSTLSPIAEETLASLFGPGKPNRKTLRHISLCAKEQNRIVNFLLEGILHLEYEGWVGSLEESSSTAATEQLEDWEKHEEEISEISDEEWERRDEIGRQKALLNYAIYKEWDQQGGSHLFDILNTSCSSDYPFQRLKTLTIQVDEESEWFLIFCTDSFPSLRLLKLSGICCELEGLKYITSNWRYSISHRSGRLIPPKISDKFRLYADDSSVLPEQDWVALSIRGDDNVNEKRYRGPHLDTLALADLRLITHPEAAREKRRKLRNA